MFLLFLLLTTSASALTIADDQVNLNVDYREFDTEDQVVALFTSKQFTIQNENDDERVYTISVSGLPRGYGGESKDVTVAGNSSIQTTFRINVTHLKAPGEERVGTIDVTGAGEQVSVPLMQKTAQMLIFNEISIDYIDDEGDERDEDFNTDEERESFDLGRNVRPGSEMRIRIDIKNRFRDKDYDYSEIEDVELTIEADDDDVLPRGFEEDYDIGDLEAKEEATEDLTFIIPDDAKAKEYTLTFTLKGEDRKGVNYEVIREVSFDLKRERDDVRITKAQLSPEKVVACGASSFSLEMELHNFGTDNQKHAGLAIFNRELGISENIKDIELDEFDDRDDTWKRTFLFSFGDQVEPGTYSLDVVAFIDRDERIDDEVVNVVVEECSGAGDQKVQNDSEQQEVIVSALPNITNPVAQEQQPATAITGNVVRSVEDPYTVEDVFVGAVIVAIVLIVTLIVVFFILLIRR